MDARRAAAIVLAAAAVLVIVAGPAVTQKVPRATCLDCHEKEGMVYANVITTPLQTLAQNETYPFEVTINNPWRHEITDATVTARLRSPNVAFETREPLSVTQQGQLAPGGAPDVELEFPVFPGATGVVVRLVQGTEPGSGDADLYLATPSTGGEPVRPMPEDEQAGLPGSTPRRATEVITYDQEGASAQGAGNWTAVARLGQTGGVVASGGFALVTLEAKVYYNSTRSLTIRKVELVEEGGSTTFTFGLIGSEPGAAELDVNARITAHYEHPAGIGAQDDGNETIRSNLQFQVGQSTTLGEQVTITEVPVNWNIIARTWAEATGWVGLFLIPISLVLGGAFGRRNVLWMNKVARNGRTRVLWHNSVSFILLAFTVVHIVLFIIEPVYEWSVGLVWGGLGTLALLGLAITGLWWRDIARAWGYHNWRTLHIAMAIAFVTTVVVHVLAEGAHFDWARQAFGFA